MSRLLRVLTGVLGLGVLLFITSILLSAYFAMKNPPAGEKPGEKSCPMDARLCPDGSAVGRSGSRCEFAPCNAAEPTETSGVSVLEPMAGVVVGSPLSIRGSAPGTWFFEGSFPVKVTDEAGVELGRGVAQAEGEWMTEDTVSFTATVSFGKPATATGYLVLTKDNPSGLPENDASVRVPLRFVAEEGY